MKTPSTQRQTPPPSPKSKPHDTVVARLLHKKKYLDRRETTLPRRGTKRKKKNIAHKYGQTNANGLLRWGKKREAAVHGAGSQGATFR